MAVNPSGRPHPGDLLTLAFELINERGQAYDTAGGNEQNYREAAAVATLILGKEVTARDVAMVLHCVKLIRSRSAPDKLDNYIDGMNYLAFAACFAGLAPIPQPAAVKLKDVSTAVATS